LIRRWNCCFELMKLEADLDTNLHVQGPPILQRRLQAPLLDGLNRPCVQAESQAADDADVTRASLIVDDQPEDAGSLGLGVTSFLGIFQTLICFSP
jgi:serine/threonine protein kinase HipA of HipAB toxin-antitoxin module